MRYLLKEIAKLWKKMLLSSPDLNILSNNLFIADCMDAKLSQVNVKSLTENVFKLLEDDWMLFTAGNRDSFNMMAASWGALGVLWNQPIAIGFIRPQRYTFEFADKSDLFTLSFFPEKHRPALNYCGSHSGRTVDKVAGSGLTPAYTERGSVYFTEARLVLECRKIYSDDIKADHFFKTSLIKEIYPKNDFHRFFIGEIVSCLSSSATIKGIPPDLSGDTGGEIS